MRHCVLHCAVLHYVCCALLQDGDIGVALSAPGGAIAPGKAAFLSCFNSLLSLCCTTSCCCHAVQQQHTTTLQNIMIKDLSGTYNLATLQCMQASHNVAMADYLLPLPVCSAIKLAQ
jgi:hypothetical protein